VLDEHYPLEEGEESNSASVPVLLDSGLDWAFLQLQDQMMNVSVGSAAFSFTLLALLRDSSGAPLAVLERSFRRWGFISYTKGTGEMARLRKGTGSVYGLSMPNYAYLGVNATSTCGGFGSAVFSNATDYIGSLLLSEDGGEVTYAAAQKFLAPQRDYANIGAMWPYQKWQVSPDGRIKSASSAIYTPTDSSADSGGGQLIFDPRNYADYWPGTNWTFIKSSLVGRHLRVVSSQGFESVSGKGYEQVAFAGVAEPSGSVYIRLRSTSGPESSAFKNFSYFNVSSSLVSNLSPAIFYSALLEEQLFWNRTFADAARLSLPGPEGARQIDTALGSLVASLSLFVSLQPNYGDGSTYWSPEIGKGGSLPSIEIAVALALLEAGLVDMAGQYVGWYMDNYLTRDGRILTTGFGDNCPDGFADGLADYGELQQLFTQTARYELAYNTVNGSYWVASHAPQMFAIANYSLARRREAVARGDKPGLNATAGMVYGSPEHDTCHEVDFYYHTNVWFIRGMLESGAFFRDVCPQHCPQYAPFGLELLKEASAYQYDLAASLNMTVTRNGTTGAVIFVPPVARSGLTPFTSMLESVLAEYTNFRYYSELLGADLLSDEYSIAVQEFRETHQGSASGITRWSDHLDEMPSLYYFYAYLRSNRPQRLQLHLYGHLANYASRGTFKATEQLRLYNDANGFFRDYFYRYPDTGIDSCVPSLMLPTLATRAQLVMERSDTAVLYLAAGAPRRWYDPANLPGFGITRAFTRFGLVSFTVWNNVTVSGERATASVVFLPVSPTLLNGTQVPLFSLRLVAYDATAYYLDPASVSVEGEGAALHGLNTYTSSILIALTPGRVSFSFAVTGLLVRIGHQRQ